MVLVWILVPFLVLEMGMGFVMFREDVVFCPYVPFVVSKSMSEDLVVVAKDILVRS
jgi:hypothetical protein